MGQLKTEKIRVGHIPVTVVHPIEDTGNPVILYHGWSSQADFQYSKAAIFAVNGYTVYIPEAQTCTMKSKRNRPLTMRKI